jgi:LacI family transcriptional regulator, sucrose operon repressor
LEKRRQVKLEDVAALAGVSKTTVSRVLNNRGYLSNDTKQKVHEAMAQLNYRPNAIARQLFTQKTNLVGLVFPTVNDPFFGQLEAGLDEHLYKRGYRTLMGNSQNNPQKEEQYLQLLLNHQIDGLIIGAHNPAMPDYLEASMPIVSIERAVAPQIPVVASDNYRGGQLATQRLLDDGCRHIIHTNYPKEVMTTNQGRREAYEDLMRTNGRPAITYEVNYDTSVEEKKAIFTRLFAEHPEVDGIFADNDTNAGLIIQVAKQLGRRVPADLKVVGFDGADGTRILFPELTTVQQSINEMATVAVELLEQQIAGQTKVASVTLPVTLLEGTTA